MGKPAGGANGFWEQEPERRDCVRPVQNSPRSASEWRATHWPRQAARRAGLPESAGGLVRVLVIGGEVRLIPADQASALVLDAMREQLGVNWDKVRHSDLGRLDNCLGRGVTGFDSILSLAATCGLTLEIDERAQSAIEAYRHHLSIQKAPIPRAIWIEDEPEREILSVEETNIMGQRGTWKRGRGES